MSMGNLFDNEKQNSYVHNNRSCLLW